jgi:3-phenylpropionate/trans-cinnamate dioxygenase ferredoxin reductase subunit
VVELAERVMARGGAPLISDFFARVHQQAGVDIRCNTGIQSFDGALRVQTVTLSDGSKIPADLVIVGIGILPNVEVAEAAGLACDNGIVVDEYCRTSDADILAIGDFWPSDPLLGKRLRLESVHNARNRPRLRPTILGKLEAYAQIPWFWSDQYDLKLQFVGYSLPDQPAVVRGDPESRSFAAFYLNDGRLSAVYAVNSPREFMLSKKLIASGARPDTAALRNTSVSFKDIAESLGA